MAGKAQETLTAPLQTFIILKGLLSTESVFKLGLMVTHLQLLEGNQASQTKLPVMNIKSNFTGINSSHYRT